MPTLLGIDSGLTVTKAVIFDIDGTLIDSVDLHAKAWHETLRHFGHDLPFGLEDHIGRVR